MCWPRKSRWPSARLSTIDDLDFAYEPEEFDENELVAAKYEGACVLEPVPGLYYNVLQYDFDSLYPSVLMAYNICYSTYLSTEPPPNMVPQMYHTVKWTSKGGDENIHHFLKEPEGIVPKLLRDLLGVRKAVKKILKSTELYTVQYNVLDKRQQALKVCANSIYGVLGVQKHGMLPLNEGASSCTALGRMSLGIAVAKFEELGATVVYGDTDSCYVTFNGIAADNFPALWAPATATEKALEACFP
ncbi:hypothetical protein SARC_03967 [Sphaeroforma arctica JP610]|uniref:DNA-directed DNA polymerase n=1 Tax=Sphaeroforma arctica JP610 TaxID=667725 RepID=A0A0L0G4R3_9EUKA|nr:hypothetical protein SARC_03967 [Sphaeroforma arctica JP610]KNC83791.1 hypothetical protein SARC_03967 [Sphaeroforma arctica JP610]|eukprot:XP_014157693.1 hypothetical protein SARC_03967 [Sphaeroforma arctica JP610]